MHKVVRFALAEFYEYLRRYRDHDYQCVPDH